MQIYYLEVRSMYRLENYYANLYRKKCQNNVTQLSQVETQIPYSTPCCMQSFFFEACCMHLLITRKQRRDFFTDLLPLTEIVLPCRTPLKKYRSTTYYVGPTKSSMPIFWRTFQPPVTCQFIGAKWTSETAWAVASQNIGQEANRCARPGQRPIFWFGGCTLRSKHTLAISSKLSHHRALKYISEALEQKLSSSKDISEAHSVL